MGFAALVAVTAFIMAILVEEGNSNPQIIFPSGSFGSRRAESLRTGLLPAPEPCPRNLEICGEDESKYPEKKIRKLVQDVLRGSSSSNTSSSSSTTVTDRFFRSSFGEVTQGRDSEPFRPACRSHTELIPRMARARNSRAKWKYLVQAERDEVQHFQVTVCDGAGSTCINDNDSPRGPETTVCKQAYKYHKMLATDESGEVTVDTFPLPSACLCHFRSRPPVGFRNSNLGGGGTLLLEQLPPSSANSCETAEETTLSGTVVSSSPAAEKNKKSRKRGRVFIDIEEVTGEEGSNSRPGRRRSNGRISRTQRLERGSRRRLITQHDSGRLVFKSTLRRPFTINGSSNVPGCPDDEEFCDGNLPGGEMAVAQVVRRSGAQEGQFGAVFGPPCKDSDEVVIPSFSLDSQSPGETDPTVRTGAPFNPREQALCSASRRYDFPRRGRAADGRYRYIVNTEEFPQGITIIKCSRRAIGRSCKYNGQEGLFPHATECRQKYSEHRMLALTDDGEGTYVESFLVPSACVCNILDGDAFLP